MENKEIKGNSTNVTPEKNKERKNKKMKIIKIKTNNKKIIVEKTKQYRKT